MLPLTGNYHQLVILGKLRLRFGVDCNPTKAAYVNHYYINQLAVEAALQSPQIDLTNSNEPTLSFDHAYAQYNANNVDGLRRSNK